MPDQRSLNDQLRDLATLADERAMYDAANFLRTMLDTPAAELVAGQTIAKRPADSDGMMYSGTTHQAITNGGSAESFCGGWNPGDRMSLFSADVTCGECLSTTTRPARG